MSENMVEEQKKRVFLEKFTKPVAVSMKTVPDNLRCPLSKLIFLDPVSIDLQEGGARKIYEREEIAKWLETQDSEPITKQKLSSKRLVKDNKTIRDVSTFLNKNTEFHDSDQLYFTPSLVDKLVKACQKENTKIIHSLCEQDRRLISWTFRFEGETYERFFGKNIFHLACQSGTRKAVEELYEQAEARCEGLGLFLILQKDDQGKTPLFHAVKKDSDSDLVHFLSEKMGTHKLQLLLKQMTGY